MWSSALIEPEHFLKNINIPKKKMDSTEKNSELKALLQKGAITQEEYKAL